MQQEMKGKERKKHNIASKVENDNGTGVYNATGSRRSSRGKSQNIS